MDNLPFEKAKNKIIGMQRQRQGIGTLQEKTVHAVLKNYYAPDEDMHEIPIDNFVADIFTGTEIMEIQTAQFNKMRGKLACFLPQYPVTIIYPIPHHKWLNWIDAETGECSKPRKSPVTGNVYKAFWELYKIKEYLPHENLRLCLSLLDVEEYRLRGGGSRERKKGWERYDRIPVALVEEIKLERREDYVQLIPYELEEPFTSADFGRAVHINKREAGNVLHILNYLEVVQRVGKKGNSYAYIVNEK